MSDLDHELFRHPIIPLARIDDPRHVEAIGTGLVSGGLGVVEVALRGAHGLSGLARLASRGDLLVGAGTVLDVRQAQDAIESGAEFIVTPGFDPVVVEHVRDAGLPIIPGVLTPSEIQAALGHGLSRLKLFPAGALDAIRLLDAYADVYRDVRFMPSGGVRPENLAATLAHRSVFAASGSWITTRAAEGPEIIADLAREAIGIAAGELS